MNTSQNTINFTNPITDALGYEEFFNTIEILRNKARTKGLTASEHILYNKVRNLPLSRGFTPAVNVNKLANGYDPLSGFKFAHSNLNYMFNYNNKVLKENFGFSQELIEVLKSY